MSLDTILLAVGDSESNQIEQLAETAIEIGGPAGATVALAYVFSKDEYEKACKQLQLAPNSEVTPNVVAKRMLNYQELSETLAAADIESTVHAHLSNGVSDGDRLTELADELAADLVIVGGHERTPTGKAVFGSTAQTIMLNAPCPVTFVRSE